LPNTTDLCLYLATVDGDAKPVMAHDELQLKLFDDSNEDPIALNSRIFNLHTKESDGTTALYKLPDGIDDFATITDKYLKKWSDEYVKADQESPFLSNNDTLPGLGECGFFHRVDLSLILWPEIVKKYPKILKFYNAFVSLPNVKEFLKNRDRRGIVGQIGSRARLPGLEPSVDFDHYCNEVLQL